MNESLRISYIDTVLSYSNLFEKFYHLKCMVEVLRGRYYGSQIKEEWGGGGGGGGKWEKTKQLLGGKCC